MFVYGLPVIKRIRVMAHRKPGVRPGKARIDFDGPGQEWAGCPRFP
ncbi:hypothetical protein J2Z31_001758 [Sinorhizobium kostiense]|uniref:Transposase n=1 Tax=Sinorhizobium kostiense TaxID=76747 RepID=A0ABS4QX91_9HYPH|nr:hypothetical protein [Sinorhizobium kostiense]